MATDTIKLLRKLRPYTVKTAGSHIDPYVMEEFEIYFDPLTLAAINEYGRSTYSDEAHLSSFMQFSRPMIVEEIYQQNTNHCQYMRQAKLHVQHALSSLRHTSLIPGDQIDKIDFVGSSAAGYGYIGNKRSNYLHARKRASQCLYYHHRFQDNFLFTPDMAFARCQVSTPLKPKIRHVWGRAFHNILIEGLLVQNLLKKVVLSDTPLYIGRDIHKHMPYHIRKAITPNAVIYCLDFTAFDATINRELLEISFEILHELLIINDAWEESLFNYVRKLFIDTPVIMPNGNLYLVTAGLPSGSLLTQLIGSILNLLLIYALQLKFFGEILATSVMGDDSIFVHPDRRLCWVCKRAQGRRYQATAMSWRWITWPPMQIMQQVELLQDVGLNWTPSIKIRM